MFGDLDRSAGCGIIEASRSARRKRMAYMTGRFTICGKSVYELLEWRQRVLTRMLPAADPRAQNGGFRPSALPARTTAMA